MFYLDLLVGFFESVWPVSPCGFDGVFAEDFAPVIVSHDHVGRIDDEEHLPGFVCPSSPQVVHASLSS